MSGIVRITNQLQELAEENILLKSENKALREALEPFGKWADEADEASRESGYRPEEYLSNLEYGLCAAARAALHKEKAQ